MSDPITSSACEEMHLLIQADLDGELDAAATVVLAAHLRDCAGCAALRQELTGLSGQLRAEIPTAAGTGCVAAGVGGEVVAGGTTGAERVSPAAGAVAVIRGWGGDCGGVGADVAAWRRSGCGAGGKPYQGVAAGASDRCGLDRPAYGEAVV